MNDLADLLPWLICGPLIVALLTSFGSLRWRAGVSLLAALLQSGLALYLLWVMQGDTTPVRYQIAGWGAPLGIDLYLDGLAALMVALTGLLALLVTIYSVGYFRQPQQAARFWPLWWLLLTGIHAIFVAADAFNIYVAIEIIGLASVALVALSDTRSALVAALRYALVGLVGSLFYLLGVALLYRSYGTLDLVQLGLLSQADPVTWAALSLITVGLLLKTALLPLHFWLPPAHGGAPAPVSAVLSALVVKTTFYLLLRYWVEVLAPATTVLAANLLGVLGSAAMVWGCLCAYRAERLKVMVAYSTVAQIGYLFLFFPLVLGSDSRDPMSSRAALAVVYFVIAHAVAKGAMFLAVGNLQRYLGHDEISRMAGISQQQPLSLFAFAIAGASLVGLPPSVGFIAKWLLLNAAIDAGQWWWLVMVLIGGLLSALYVGRVLSMAFTQVKEGTLQPATKTGVIHPLMAFAALGLALLAIALGFNAEWVLVLLEERVITTQPLIVGL